MAASCMFWHERCEKSSVFALFCNKTRIFDELWCLVCLCLTYGKKRAYAPACPMRGSNPRHQAHKTCALTD